MPEFVQSEMKVIKPDGAPDQARTREFQAESRGHRISIQPVDDTACLTEEELESLETFWIVKVPQGIKGELSDIPANDDGIIQTELRN